MSVMPRWIPAALLAAVLPAAGHAAAPQDARERAEEFLAKRGASRAQVEVLTDAALARTLPGWALVTARFRQYPVAFEVPEGFAPQNLLAVPARGEIRLLRSPAELEAFFREQVARVKGKAAARDAIRSWLHLSEELLQDGYYQFEIPEESLRVTPRGGGWSAAGTSRVAQGGKGEILATLTFSRSGALAGIQSASRVMPGVRPICQATKLLDPDPLVRRMAEQDLLVMGRAAREYLREQRERASPELRAAIDRVWRRLVEEGW